MQVVTAAGSHGQNQRDRAFGVLGLSGKRCQQGGTQCDIAKNSRESHIIPPERLG
jgi:hypothetical protein